MDVRGPIHLGGAEEARVLSEGEAVVTRCSVSRGRSPSPGFQRSSYYWRDIVMGPPPRRREKGDCMHVVYHGMDATSEVRLAFTTLVSVDPGFDKESTHDDIVRVEERLNVQRRPLQEFIDSERAYTERASQRMRSQLAHRLVAQRRFVNTVKTSWIARMLLVLIRFEARAGTASIRAFRTFMRALVAVPDRVLTQTTNISIHLGSRYGRKILRRAIRDPASATPQEKTVALVVSALLMGALIFFFSFLNTTFPGPYSEGYVHVQKDFIASILGVLALPIPLEVLLVLGVVSVGSVLAFTGLFLGKMVGSWMLYLMGDALYDGIRRKGETRPKLKRRIDWLQANADRYGFGILTAINAIPFVPDMIIIVFAVSGMRFRSYALGIALGTIIKFVGIIIAVNLVGPELIQAFMEHPIQTMRGG